MTEAKDRQLLARLIRHGKVRSGLTWEALSASSGLSATHLKRLAFAGCLPSPEAAVALSESLASPSIPTVLMRIRTRRCERCGATFLFARQGARQRYCDRACQRWAQDERVRDHTIRGTRSELAEARARATAQTNAIAAFCASCEPEGYCHEAACELRAVSPLPLSRRAVA